MNDLELLLGKVSRDSFIAGFFVGSAFVGIAVLIGLLF